MKSISAGQFLAHTREKCEEDFTFFVRYFFKHLKGRKFIFSEHHHKICDALMDVFFGRTTYLIINIAPRYSKTELVVKMFSAWCYAKNPSCEFIHLSYSDSLALDNSDTIKQILKSFEFQQLWPHVKIRQNKDSKKSWETESGGNFYATAAGGAVTGFGAGKIDDFENGNGFSGSILIDDALKPDDAFSEVKRTAVNSRWDGTIKSRFNSTKTPCIVVAQRLHEDDFCSMLENDPEYDFKVLSMPAIINEGEDNEKALWHDKHTLEQLKSMKEKNPYMFSSQMQQKPSPVGGGMFKDKYWKYYDVLPPDIDLIRIYADTAQKTKEQNDYSVFQVWGRSRSNMAIYLIDQCRGKWEAPELEIKMVELWNKHKPSLHRPLGAQMVKIEDKSSGSSLIQSIKRDHFIPVEPIQRNTDKVFRAMGVVKYFASGHIYIPANEDWVHDYKEEFRKFTPMMTHKHDDQIDPTMDAVEDLIVFQDMLYTESTLN